ncbi:MAG: patatin-like phospholipase family protein, partial [Saprospiraceae bacterium]|nr:patatin-like phospholipase family protein [Saprospiraceae bacterium]
MDAGIRDNYGMLSATRFIQVFRKWIEQNTSGVVLVQVSSSELIEEIVPSNRTGAISRLVNPVGILGKVFTLQEFEHDNSLGFIYDLLGPERFEVIRFVYHPTQRKKLTASVSFHITSREKADVKRAIGLPENKTEMERLMNLLK